MGVEIERKFLTKNDNWRHSATSSCRMKQGYLNEIGNTIRIRLAGDRAFLTIKGKTKGISRLEFEYEVPVSDAEQLFTLCQTPSVEKIRHKVPFEGHIFEVDEFLGQNEGLTVAEVELNSENEDVSLPEWIGEDVTADKRYRNTHLAKKPFKQWDKE